MSDTYQPIYDAVRSSLRNTDVGASVYEAIRLGCDASHAIVMIRQDFCIAASEMQKPSVLYRPSLSIDGDQWCALYGENLQDGVAGFGKSAYAAMLDFDKNWHANLTVQS